MSDKPTIYEGEHLDVQFEGKRCIHARKCVLSQPDVFVANAPGPWIHPDEAHPEALAAMIRTCPSGALTFTRKDGGLEEQPPVKATVRLQENGPLEVRAEMTLNGEPMGHRATLCRCGQSANKPYCDGAHTKAGFEATSEPPTGDKEDIERGPVEVKTFTDGPLAIMGPVEIIAGSGRTVSRTQRTFLCRCGHSKNKPYCDGSHKRAGFTAD